MMMSVLFRRLIVVDFDPVDFLDGLPESGDKTVISLKILYICHIMEHWGLQNESEKATVADTLSL